LGQTSLHLAAKGGHLEVVKFLLEDQADVLAVDHYGRNALDLTALKPVANIKTSINRIKVSCLLCHHKALLSFDKTGKLNFFDKIKQNTLNFLKNNID